MRWKFYHKETAPPYVWAAWALVQTYLPNIYLGEIQLPQSIEQWSKRHLCSGVIFSTPVFAVLLVVITMLSPENRCCVMTSLLFQAEFNASSEFSSDKTTLCSAAVFFHLIHSCGGKKNPNNQSEPIINCSVTRELVLRSVFQFRWQNPFFIGKIYLLNTSWLWSFLFQTWLQHQMICAT